MPADLPPIDKAKFVAAKRAVGFIEGGMRVGLGTGSTAAWMVRCLGERVRSEGLKITGVPTSNRTAALAREEGIEVVTLEEARWLDLTIDGTDEFDAAKEVAHLGAFPLPIEVIGFGWQTSKALVEEMLVSLDVLGREVTLRMNGDRPYMTDEGNRILDLHLGRIGNARQLALVLNQVPGVVENGLFIDICDRVIIGHGDGRVETRDINTGTVERERIEFAETDNLFADLGE